MLPKKMKLLTVHKDNFVNVVENGETDLTARYGDVFNKSLVTIPGKVRLEVLPECKPVVLPARKVPVSIDDLLPDLADARVFTKVDLASAFCQLDLDHESSMLTTFATPYGRYRWLRLPFGLCVSSEIFQRRLHQEEGNVLQTTS